MFYKAIQRKLANLIIPIAGKDSSSRRSMRRSGMRTIKKYNDGNLNGDTISSFSGNVAVGNDALLDTRTLCPGKQQKLAINEQIFVIKLNPNAAHYEAFISDYAHEVAMGDYNITCFNYQGVGLSTGTSVSTQDWVDGAVAQVKAQIRAGADPEKIYLDGRSIGGAIAVLATKQLHDEGIKVNVYNRYSFSTLGNVVGAWVSKPFQKIGLTKIAGSIFSGVSKLTSKVLKHYKLEMDAASAYNEIPDDYKDYSVIKTSKKIKATEKVGDDKIILPAASLHRSQRKVNREEKSYLKLMQKFSSNDDFPETDLLTLSSIEGTQNIAYEIAKAVDEHRPGDAAYLIRIQKASMAGRKVTLRTGDTEEDPWRYKDRSGNAHNVSTWSLQSRSGEQAIHHFNHFVSGTTALHKQKRFDEKQSPKSEDVLSEFNQTARNCR